MRLLLQFTSHIYLKENFKKAKDRFASELPRDDSYPLTVCQWRAKERESQRGRENTESGVREKTEEKRDAAQHAEGKVSAPAEENVL